MTENNENGYASVYVDRYREDGAVLRRMLNRAARALAEIDDFGLADAMVAAAVRVEELDKAGRAGGDALEASYAAHLETTAQLKERTSQSKMLADELIAAYRWIDRFASNHEPGEPSGARDMRDEARGVADDMLLADALADADMLMKSGCSDYAVLCMKTAFQDATNLGVHGGHCERSIPNLRLRLSQLEAENKGLRERVADLQILQLDELLSSPIGMREKSRAALKKTKADDDIGF